MSKVQGEKSKKKYGAVLPVYLFFLVLDSCDEKFFVVEHLLKLSLVCDNHRRQNAEKSHSSFYPDSF
jgi:hypothetical protein